MSSKSLKWICNGDMDDPYLNEQYIRGAAKPGLYSVAELTRHGMAGFYSWVGRANSNHPVIACMQTQEYFTSKDFEL